MQYKTTKLTFMKNTITGLGALASVLFGLLSVFTGGSVILDLFGMRKNHGDYVLFVVWANFLSGFFYVIASYGFLKMKNWTSPLLLSTLYLLVATSIALLIWVWNGSPYENKTLNIMSFRIALTAVLWLMARSFRKRFSISMIL